MDSEDASEATEVTTARERAKEGGGGEEGAREMIVPEKKMMLPPPSSPHFKRGGRADSQVGWRARHRMA